MHFTFFVGFKMYDKFVGSRTGKATGKSKMVSLIFLYKKIYIYIYIYIYFSLKAELQQSFCIEKCLGDD